MKQLMILFLAIFALAACEKPTVGFLDVKNAAFTPDTLEIRTVLDPKKDANREKSQAPWVSGAIRSVLGTDPKVYEFVSVTSTAGEEAASLFASELKVYGNSRMEVPLQPAAPKGSYRITLKVRNEGYSALLPDIFTFIIK